MEFKRPISIANCLEIETLKLTIKHNYSLLELNNSYIKTSAIQSNECLYSVCMFSLLKEIKKMLSAQSNHNALYLKGIQESVNYSAGCILSNECHFVA